MMREVTADPADVVGCAAPATSAGSRETGMVSGPHLVTQGR